jgi:hypothetical protein
VRERLCDYSVGEVKGFSGCYPVVLMEEREGCLLMLDVGQDQGWIFEMFVPQAGQRASLGSVVWPEAANQWKGLELRLNAG